MKRTEIIILITLFFFTNISCKGNTERKTMESALDSILNVALADTVKKSELEKNSFILSCCESTLFFAENKNRIFVDGGGLGDIINFQRSGYSRDIYIVDPLQKKALDSVNTLSIINKLYEETHLLYYPEEIKFFMNNSEKIKIAYSNQRAGVIIGDYTNNKIINIKDYYYGFDDDYTDSISNQKLNLDEVFYCQKDNSHAYAAPRILYQDTLYAGVKSAQIYDKDTFLYSIDGNNFTFKNKVKLNTDSVETLLPFPVNNKIYFYYFLSNGKTIIYGYDIKKCSAKKYVLDFAIQVDDGIYFTNSGFLISFETVKTDDYYDSYKYSFIRY